MQPAKLTSHTLIGNNKSLKIFLYGPSRLVFGFIFLVKGDGKWKLGMKEESYGKMVKGGRKRGRNNGICEKGKEKHVVSRNVHHTISYAQCRIE